MTSISERLRKEMEEKGLLGTDAKKAQVVVNTSRKKAAEKSAPSLLSQGQRVDVVKDTGAKSIIPDTKNAINALMEQRQKYKDTQKEIQAVGKSLINRGATDFASYQAAAQKQMDLQKQLPSASFAAGLLNSMGADVAKITAKASGNEALQKNWLSTLQQLQETQEANATAGTLGALTGEFAKAGAGYMTIGKAAEKGTLKAAEKLMGGKALTKGGEAITRLLGQQMADTAVNTPITIAAGLAEDKSGKEIAKNVGKQMAMDAAFNVGLEGLGAIGGIVRAKNAQKKIPQQLEAEEHQQTANNWLENLYLNQPLMLPKPTDWYVGNDGSLYRSFEEKDLLKQTELQVRNRGTVNFGINPTGLGELERNKKQPYRVYHGKQIMQADIPENLKKETLAQSEKIKTVTENVLQNYGITDIYSSSNVVNGIIGKIRNTFLSTAEHIRPITNEATGLPIEVWKRGIDETFRKGKYYPALSEEMKIAKIASVEQLPELIRTAKVKADDVSSYHGGTAKEKYLYLENEMQIDGKAFDVSIDIKKLPGGSNRFHLHKITIKEAASAQRDFPLAGPPLSGNQLAASINSIADAAGNVKGTAAKAEKINEVADTMMRKRNVLAKPMTKEERQALELEYANLKNSEYRAEQLKKINEETKGDPKAIREAASGFDGRMKEIEGTLATQEALRTQNSIQKDVAAEIMDIFSLRGKKNKQGVNNALQQVMLEAKEGKISEKTRNDLFETLFARSDESRTGLYGLKEKLRKKQLVVDTDIAADIADITEWNNQLKGKGILGKLKIGGVENNVESFYGELNKAYPAYFPEAIDKPAEQLRQMRKVAERLSSGNFLGKEDYKANFNRAMDRLEDAVAVRTAYSGKLRESLEGFRSNLLGRTDYGTTTPQEVQSWHSELSRLKKNAEGLTEELSKKENRILEEMLDGDTSEAQARASLGPRYKLVKQHYDAKKPLRELEEKINGWNSYTHAKRYEKVAEAAGEIHIGEGDRGVWKDKSMPSLYGRETMERNLRDITDAETAERVNRTLIEPIHASERDRQNFMRTFKKKIKQANISTKRSIRTNIPGMGEQKVSESFLVQWLGENEYTLKQMMDSGAPEASYKALASDIAAVRNALTPEQSARISGGIETFRSIYEELHPLINEVLIKNGYEPIGYIEGYFPHMNFDDPNGPMETAAKLLGFDMTAKELPMDIAGRTEEFRPGKKWAGNLLTRTGQKTDYDALRAFDLYIDNISDVIYHTDNIQNLRAFEDYMRYSTSDEGLQKKIDEIRRDKSKTTLERQEAIDKLYKENAQNHKLQNFVNYVRTYTDLLAGKKHRLDRGMETEFFGRKAYKFFNTLENKVAGNMVGGNIGSAFTNFIPITQAIGSVGPKNGLKGMKEALGYLCGEGMDELTKKSAFLSTRQGPEMLYRTTLDKISDGAGKLMEIFDTFTTQAVWRGRYYDNLGKGMSEANAIRNADEYARGLFGGRSKGAIPTLLMSKNPLIKPFTMFQLEVNNQVSYLLKDIPREAQGDWKKMAGRYTGIIIGAYLYNDIYEKLTGRRSALDPFDIGNEFIGDTTGRELRNTVDIIGDAATGKGLKLTEKVEKKSTAQALAGLTANVGGNIPFVGGVLFDGGRVPIQSALPGWETLAEGLGNVIDGGELEAPGKATLMKELAKPLWYLGMPTAGGQIKKTIEGYQTMQKGGRYSQSKDGEKLQFATDQDSNSEWLKALAFGQWATEGGKAYNENSRQMLSANQTETYKKLVAAGAKNTMAYEEISKIRAKEKNSEKRSAIRSSLFTDEQKAILYYDLVAEKGSRDRETLDYYEGRTSRPQVAETLSRMAEYSDNAMAKRSVLRNSSLSESDKRYLYLNNAIGESSVENEAERLDAAASVDIGIDAYFTIRNKYSQLKEQGGKVKNNWINWMRSEGYSGRQIYVMGEAFGWNMD